jgi:hypothetical protein
MECFPPETTGGIPALRGFRKQFLHTLHRILGAESEIICPETLEDFAVINSFGHLVEVVQVKDHKTPLTFSEIQSLFFRSSKLLNDYPDCRIVLASYGNLGPELEKAIKVDHEVLKRKIKFNTPEILRVFEQLEYVQLQEDIEFKGVQELLSEFPMALGDWKNTFDLLMQDLYLGAESGRKYTKQSCLNKIQQIGQYLAGRQAHNNEWYVSIIPLVESVGSHDDFHKDSFFEGASTKWSHVTRGLDVIRPRYMEKIERGFLQSNIVILHGASGQGKSALAYRFLHDFCCSTSRYEILDVSTHKRALEVATALSGYGVPLTFFVDAGPGDKGLALFLSRVSELENINILVSIREEDWRLLDLTSDELLFTEFEVSFSREEAQEIYSAWSKKFGCRFPDFEQAWAKFSEAGPLLEFVHLLNYAETLQNRLRKQYARLADEVDCNKRSSMDLKLLQVVAIAGTFGARIDVSKLSEGAAVKRSISRLENEYLVQCSENGRHLTGLHSIRCKSLVSIFSDKMLSPWETHAVACLPLLEDDDLEFFLVCCFKTFPEVSGQIISYLNSAHLSSWVAVGGIMRALMWRGIFNYVHLNRDLFEDVYNQIGNGWRVYLDLDFLNLLDGKSAFSSVLNLFSGEKKLQVEEWQRKQTPKQEVFTELIGWGEGVKLPSLPPPDHEVEWENYGQFSYWIGFLEIDSSLLDEIDWGIFNKAVEVLPLESLATFIYGIWHASSETAVFKEWYKERLPTILERYRKETRTPRIEQYGEAIRAQFIVDLEAKKEDEENRFHREALYHLEILAQLFPDFEAYGCQGYGHQVFDFGGPDDTSKAKVKPHFLIPAWVTHINRTARILVSHLYRPETWKEYCAQTFKHRSEVTACLQMLSKELIRHFRSKKVVAKLPAILDSEHWRYCTEHLSKIPDFPLEALDRLGFTEENKKQNPLGGQSDPKEAIVLSAYLTKYKYYLKVKSEFDQGVSNFLQQAPDYILAHAYLGKAKNKHEVRQIREKIKTLNINVDRPELSCFNLSESLKKLQDFQVIYREHFSNLLNEEELADLEKNERQTFRNLWCLWYFFSHKPTYKNPFPSKAIREKMERHSDQIRKKINTVLNSESSPNLWFCLLSNDLKFDKKATLWLTVDGKNLLEIYSCLDYVFDNLNRAFGNIKIHSLEYYSLDFQWQQIGLIPLLKGKMMDSHAWIIPFYKFVTELNENDVLSPLNHSLRPVDVETIDSLKLDLWDQTILSNAKLLFTSFSSLYLRLKNFVMISKISGLDELGIGVVQYYIDGLPKKLSEDFQIILDQFENLASLYNQLTEDERKCEEFGILHIAVEKMLLVKDKLRPVTIQVGNSILSDDDMCNWLNDLETIQGDMYAIYLCWCGYLLSKESA